MEPPCRRGHHDGERSAREHGAGAAYGTRAGCYGSKKTAGGARKFNPYHDERGRFTEADNAVAAGSPDAAALMGTLERHPANRETQVAATAVEVGAASTIAAIVAAAIAAHNAMKPVSVDTDGEKESSSSESAPNSDSGTPQSTSITKPEGIPDD